MKPGWMVYTDIGDYKVYATDRSDAFNQVKNLTYGRAVIVNIERIS